MLLPAASAWACLARYRPAITANSAGGSPRTWSSSDPREDGKPRYAKRKETVEPVFGHIKNGRGAGRFLRRGLRGCEAEWKLLRGTHNLLKLWRHTIMRPVATPRTA
jgi:Transposase DDE domain